MVRSLRFQVLWAPALVVMTMAALLGIESWTRDITSERFRAVADMRRQLDRALLRLSDRHARTLRRVREALLEPRPDHQIAILAWTSQHYLQEMDRYLAKGRDTVRSITIPHANRRLETDLTHLERQLDRIGAQTQQVVPALDGLLEAVSDGDPEVLRAAQQDLDRADKAMSSHLRVAERMVQRISGVQSEYAAAPWTPIPRWLWIACLLLAALALWVAQRPVARLARLASELPEGALSREEMALVQRIQALDEERQHIEGNLSERNREAERAANAARRAEHELALLNLYNENLVNSLRSAIVVTDVRDAVTGFNRAARKLLGCEPSLRGTPIYEHAIFASLGRRSSDAHAELARAKSERQMLRFDSLPFPATDGEVLLDLTIAPYLDESGAARGLLWVTDDVTDAIRIKKQLLAAERLAAVGSLSAQVAHEIRNPLSAIGLNAELLEEELATGLAEPRREEAAALLRAIASEVERLTQITEGYLQLTRLPEPQFRDADLNQVVSDLFSMLEEELKSHGVAVLLDLATPAPRAWADPGQLRQALLNIVRNAREAMPDGGSLQVRTLAKAGSSVVEIADSGPGIAADVAPRVFEPFYTTKRDGTGLGLSLTQQIVAEHHGEVSVISHPPNGTLIRLRLPSQAEAAGSTRP